uniref:Uncharacterized protein n=1 Tax=Triticum aestivum TaxID=4565 RepID=A0A3B5XYS6_WHEAT
MDVYISEEYVIQRRAEKRAAARRAATADAVKEEAGRSRWTAPWADSEQKANADAHANAIANAAGWSSRGGDEGKKIPSTDGAQHHRFQSFKFTEQFGVSHGAGS